MRRLWLKVRSLAGAASAAVRVALSYTTKRWMR
jgi:hypothetical protein